MHLQITGTHGERDHKQITSAGTSHRKIHPREPVMKDGTLNQMGIATWLGAVAAVSVMIQPLMSQLTVPLIPDPKAPLQLTKKQAATIGVTPARVVLQAGSKAEVEQTATGAIITLADRLMMAVAAGVEVARPKVRHHVLLLSRTMNGTMHLIHAQRTPPSFLPIRVLVLETGILVLGIVVEAGKK